MNVILPKGQELEKRRYGTFIRSSTVMLLKTAQNQFSIRLSATTCSYWQADHNGAVVKFVCSTRIICRDKFKPIHILLLPRRQIEAVRQRHSKPITVHQWGRKLPTNAENNTDVTLKVGTAVTQWSRCCVTNRKVAGSIPDGVIGIFFWHKFLPITLWPWCRLSL